MDNFKILVAKEIDEKNLDVSFSKEYERKTNPEIEANIDREWEKALEETPKLFPGLKFRLSNIKEANGKVNLSLGITNYKEHIGTSLSKENIKELIEKGKNQFNDENAFMSNTLGNMCVVETSDGKIVFFKRSQNVAEYKGYIEMPGGHPEPGELDITPDNLSYAKTEEEVKKVLFGSAEEELIAELNLTQPDIGKIKCIGFITNTEINKPDMIFYTKLKINAKRLEELYKEGPEEGFESEGLIFIEKNELKDYMSNQKITPAAYASIECYSKLNAS